MRASGDGKVDAALLDDGEIGTVSHDDICATEPRREDRLWQSTR